MRDDIDQARKAGYSDEQILTVLGETNPNQKAEIEGALRQGYTADQVLSVMQEQAGEAKRAAIKDQSWAGYAADLGRAVVYGAGADARGIGTALAAPADQAQGGTMDQIGDAVRSGGQTVQGLAAGYKPAEFDVMHPIATASELPKAAAEAAPGILAAVGTGALGGAVAGPVGAVVGGVGGAAVYGLAKYWGNNAQAHAENSGRSAPTQEDFDATRNASLLQAGVDAASLKAGGVIGKGIGQSAVSAAGKAVGAPVGGAVSKVGAPIAEAAVMGAAGGVNDVIGQTTANAKDGVFESLADVDLHQAANAAGTGVGVRGVIAGVRAPGEVAGAIKYRSGGDINSAAISRVIDHMASEGFAGDVLKPGQTAQNVKMIRGRTNETLSQLSKNPEAIALSPQGKLALDEARSAIKQGGFFDEAQLQKLQRQIGNDTVFNAVAEANAANWIARKAGTSEGQTMMDRIIGTALRNPGKAGGLGAAAFEGLPLVMQGLSLASGGKIAGAALAARAMSKVSGVDSVMNRPLEQIHNRYGSGFDPADPRGQLSSGARIISDFEALREAQRQAGLKEDGSPAAGSDPGPTGPGPGPGPGPGAGPGAGPRPGGAGPEAGPAGPAGPRPGGPGAAPEPGPTGPRPGAAPGPQTPPHGSLNEAMGGAAPEPRFSPQPARRVPVNADEIDPPAMSTSSIYNEVLQQAATEGRHPLEVAQEQMRSSYAIRDSAHLPQSIRDKATAQIKAIREEIINPLAAESSQAAQTRSASSKQVQAGPASAEISAEGNALLQKLAPQLAEAIQNAPTQAAATKAVDQFLGKFKGTDRKIVQAELMRQPAIRKATQTSTIKQSAAGAKAIKAAKAPKGKGKRGPKGPRKP